MAPGTSSANNINHNPHLTAIALVQDIIVEEAKVDGDERKGSVGT